MSFTGKLDQFSIPELLQILATGGKSGKLVLTRAEDQAIVVFRRGKIIYAATTSAREALGNLLLFRNLITQEQLASALDLQRKSGEEKRLGSILVEIGALERADLEAVVKRQVQRVIREFLEWKTGYFKFDLADLPDHGEIEVDASDFLLSEGLSADKLLLDATAEIEALEQRRAEESAAAASGAAGAEPVSPALGSLKSMMAEIRSPEFTGEVTAKILGFARNAVRRGVLFFIRRDSFRGMGQFGLASDESRGNDLARRISIPVDQPSILAEAAQSKSTVRGPLEDLQWNHYLVSQLGGALPAESIAIPLVVNDRSMLVFYGDNLPDAAAIGPPDELELLLLQAGLAIEKNLLHKRMEQFRRLRGGEPEF